MSTLAEFLLARITEDEAVAGVPPLDWDSAVTDEQQRLHNLQPHTSDCGWRLGEGMADECECGYPARVLAECEAKRRIAMLHRTVGRSLGPYLRSINDSWCAECREPGPACPTLRLIALPYSDHPDYDEAWRP